jgi:hypothetical protein
MKTFFSSLFIIITAAHLSLGSPPNALIRDLDHMVAVRTFQSVAALPTSLKQALARTFDQKELELANPSNPERRSSFAQSEKPLPPARRLRFSFETKNYFIVYYDVGHPWGSAFVLAFPKEPQQEMKVSWGGADSG